MTGEGRSARRVAREHARPDHFSTYVPRELVRRLKVVATLQDVPLWSLVTAALESYLESFEHAHGRLPRLADEATREKE